MNPRQRKAIRAACDLTGTPYPIMTVGGDQPPRLEGESYYWTTPSGKTRVRHPNAYGWPTTYHRSTRRITVGVDWIKKNLCDPKLGSMA